MAFLLLLMGGIPILRDIGPVLTGSGTVDVVRPILDYGHPLHPLVVCFVLGHAEPVGKKPSKHYGHDEANGDNADYENEGNVEDDGRGNATDTFCVDEANPNDIL